MKSAILHGVLLAVMLIVGYKTWTHEETAKSVAAGTVVLWDKTAADLKSVTYTTAKRTVHLDHRIDGATAYWWGSETKAEPRPPELGATPPAEPGPDVTTTREFPVGDGGDKLISLLTAARALRSLGVVNDANKKEYKLDDATTTLTIAFTTESHAFVVGGKIYGSAERYVLDTSSGKGYVVAGDFTAALEAGESGLRLADPRGFDAALIQTVVVTANGKPTQTWADPVTAKPDQTIANFIDNANNLRPSRYEATLKPSEMTLLVTLKYGGANKATLGSMALYRREKVGEIAEGETLDPANPPATTTEYYLVTEKTRVPGLVPKSSAERVEQDIATLFGP